MSFYKLFINAALTADFEAVVETVLLFRKYIDTPGRDSATALMWAAMRNDTLLVKLLLQHGAGIECRDLCGRTALIWAARAGAPDALNALLHGGARVDSTDIHGCTALIWAALVGCVDSVAVLLRAGADTSQWHGRRCAPLPAVARAGREDLVLLLLSAGCDVNQADEGGSTALASAAYSGHANIEHLLLQRRDVNVNSRDCNGDTPLMLAALGGHPEAVSMLVERGADIDGQDAEGCTPLCWACRAGSVELVASLLKGRPNVNARDRGGSCALSWAAAAGRAEITAVLLEQKGIDPYIQDTDGNTAFHLASNETTLRCMLAHSAAVRLDVLNNDGKTWADMAESRGLMSEECVELTERSRGEYYVSKSNVGRAIVINVTSLTADHLEEAQQETEALGLRDALMTCGYEVDVHKNLTASEIVSAVARLAASVNTLSSLIFLCFMSPAAEQSKVIGSDGVAVPSDKIFDLFSDESSHKRLHRRPKVFYFHSRGDATVADAACLKGSEKRDDRYLTKTECREHSVCSLPPLPGWHFLTVSSSVSFHETCRSPISHCSSFPQTLAKVMMSCRDPVEVQLLFTKVKTNLTQKQVAETRSTLDKHLFLSTRPLGPLVPNPSLDLKCHFVHV